MITNISVNGFRSLLNFNLSLKPGINILVGPNGSGKTNIIAFFEFLSHVISTGTSDAINNLGGAGSVFSKCTGTADDFQHNLEATIIGSAQNNSKFLNYSYYFNISASEDFNKIEFSKQILKICYSDIFISKYPESQTSFTIEKDVKDSKPKYTISNYDKKYVDSPFFSMISKEIKKTKNESALEKFFADFVEDEMSLVAALNFIFHGGTAIASDLRSGQVFNFIPTKIKTPEETSCKIGIKKDGSGLASTLYAIETRKGVENGTKVIARKFLLKRNQIESNLENVFMEDIMKYVKVANKSIQKVTVFNDRFENLLKIKFHITKKNETIVLPITSMSDGTIKWLSFITSILTSPTVFSIEEPENYLHPLMQSEVIKLMRNSIENKKKISSIIMSTHSETILNNASPEEIIITEFRDGATTAKRCINASEINEEIKATGFGLGYYYISGSIEHE